MPTLDWMEYILQRLEWPGSMGPRADNAGCTTPTRKNRHRQRSTANSPSGILAGNRLHFFSGNRTRIIWPRDHPYFALIGVARMRIGYGSPNGRLIDRRLVGIAQLAALD